MEAIEVFYYWEGSVLPNKNLKFTISKSCLIDLIQDMAKNHARPHMQLGRLKREVNKFDLDRKIRWVEINDYCNSTKELTIVTEGGYRYVMKEKDKRKMVS